jgi:DNA polymerase III delta prime subunit
MAVALREHPTSITELKELLRQRFPSATLVDQPEQGVLASYVTALDALLPGGVPRGALTLFAGSPSSGKTSAALAFASEATQREERVAWVHSGAFSSPSAAWSSVVLSRLLLVRARDDAQALRCADLLLRWRAFDLVVLDWSGPGGHGARWSRLGKLLSGTRTALIVLAPPPPEGDPLRFAATVHLELAWRPAPRPARRRHLRLTPSEDGGLTLSLRLVRSRFGPADRADQHTIPNFPGAPLPLLPDLPGLGQRWHDDLG